MTKVEELLIEERKNLDKERKGSAMWAAVISLLAMWLVYLSFTGRTPLLRLAAGMMAGGFAAGVVSMSVAFLRQPWPPDTSVRSRLEKVIEQLTRQAKMLPFGLCSVALVSAGGCLFAIGSMERDTPGPVLICIACAIALALSWRDQHRSERRIKQRLMLFRNAMEDGAGIRERPGS